jgi:hypothetical protein
MSLRFRRRIGFPGLHINLSRSGVSLTAGVPGLRVTMGKRPAVSVGLPGTGISYRESLSSTPPAPAAAEPVRTRHVRWPWIALAIAIVAWLILGLAACSGSAPMAAGDPCSASISADIQSRGTPDSRTDSGDTTLLYWGRMHIEYIRQNATSCFVSNPISN